VYSKKRMRRIKDLVELQWFGVCTWWADKLGVSLNKVRLFFIYSSFLTAGSPIVVYLMMGFILDIRKAFRKKGLEEEG
jgi:phage shock protein C